MIQVWSIYHQTRLKAFKKIEDLVNDTFKVALFTGASNASATNQATPTYAFIAASGEVAGGNGYSTGGATLAVLLTQSGGTVTFTVTVNPTFTAAGGPIAARFAAVYDATTGDAFCWLPLSLDGSGNPVDVTITSGQTMTINIAGTNLFTATQTNSN